MGHTGVRDKMVSFGSVMQHGTCSHTHCKHNGGGTWDGIFANVRLILGTPSAVRETLGSSGSVQQHITCSSVAD